MAIEYASFFMKFLGVLSPAGDNTGTGGLAEVLVDQNYGNGTSAGQGNTTFHDERELAASANEDIDLTTILDGNGVALGTAEVPVLLISALASNGAEIHITPGSSNGWTALISGTAPVLHLLPGMTIAVQMTADPALAVGAADKVLNFANQDGSAAVKYTLTLLARNA